MKDIKDKIGQEARLKINERKEFIRKRKENRVEIANISKEISQAIRNHRKLNRLNILREQTNKTGGIKSVLRQLKDHITWIPKTITKDKDNQIQTATIRQHILKTATDFYKKIYTDNNRTEDTSETLIPKEDLN